MIEFKGKLSGETKDFFWQRQQRHGLKVATGVFLFLWPLALFLSWKSGLWSIALVYFCSTLAIYGVYFIPPDKSTVQKMEPIRIYTEDEYIICITESGIEEYSSIQNVLKLVDGGKFYYIVLPLGKVNLNFVMQKDLLIQGTLEEFESLFDTIERKPFHSRKKKD